MELRGKKVVVTGGARGLGRCLVDQLVSREAAVAVFDHDEHGLEELNAQQPTVHTIACDVADYQQVVTTTALYHHRFGSADALVNNAGIIYSAPLVGIGSAGYCHHDAQMWDRVIATDLSSVFYMTACIVEKMLATRTRGVVVNVSSVAAAGNAGQSAYAAAKAGVNALTATWAKELGPLGIRVAAVAPGFVDTASTRHAMSEGAMREMVRRIPLGRLGKSEEVAAGVLALLENDYFHGRIFAIDGGLVL